MALCPRVKGSVFLIDNVHIDTVLQKILYDIVFTTLDGIEDWCLSIIIDEIMVSSIRYELFDGLQMTLSRSVENGGLTVSVDLVDLAVALLHQEINQLKLPFSRSIIQSGLVEVVRLVSAYSHFSEDSGHFHSLLIVFDKCSREHRRLLVVGLIQELAHIIPMCLVILNHLVDVAILHMVQELLHVSL